MAAASAGALSACSAAKPGSVASVAHNNHGYAGTFVGGGYALPKTALIDTSGSAFDLASSIKTPIAVVFFGYTNCPDVCTGIVSDLASAKRRIDDRTLAEKVTLVFVTTDPARDDAPTLRAYLDRIDPGFVGVTGDLKTIVAAASAIAVPIEQGRRLASGGYEVDHGTQVQAFGQGRLQIVWTAGASIANYKNDLTKLAQQF